MSSKKVGTAGPLTLGKEIQVFDETVTAAGSKSQKFSIDAESVLISLFVGSVSGDVDVTVTTEGKDGHDVNIITFPTISSPTTDLLLRKAASALQRVTVTVTYTDACSFNIRARGVGAGAASVSIEGAAEFRVSQNTVTTTTELLLPASLTDRQGILIYNNSTTEVLNISETSAKVTTGVEVFPIQPGGNITVDLAAGQEIYAAADSGSVDVKIVEIGGS